MATLITPNGTTTTVTPANGTSFTLRELQSLIDGYIAPIYSHADNDTMAYVDEEGLLKGLPRNIEAERYIYKHFRIPYTIIVGNVLILPRSQA